MAFHGSLYVLLFIFIIQGTSSQNCLCARGFCDEGWVQYRNACYMHVKEPANWMEAEVICQNHNRNSHLASIHSAEENDFIFHLMGKPLDYTKGKAYWIGAHDTFKEGTFMWADGSLFDFQTFGPNQPDGLPGEHYLGSWSLQNGFVTWNDFGISWKFPFVCKYSMRDSRCHSNSCF
uniref:C-type lectin domain-containing protein n=1 Tax=Sphenodon punctatus TaxID=8508 RepID=A0A8D0GVY3_SPHPU